MKKLRSGYTTGACAAAAAKGAAELICTRQGSDAVTIPFPDGSRVAFKIHRRELNETLAWASVIKDGGDDPDVTNGAEIVATARLCQATRNDLDDTILIRGGYGVGIVTKPGLSVGVGDSAINPVPLKMIRAAVGEALGQFGAADIKRAIEITISVPRGKELAQKTLNKRLGILGGISILGTTGIVKPVSAAAWTATIATSMNVASAAGLDEIVLSTGRTSERCVNDVLNLPDEALIMMGDYLEFSLEETRKHRFDTIHMATMWAKLLKGAMRVPQTHVRHGVVDVTKILAFFELNAMSPSILDDLKTSHTAREVLDRLITMGAIDIVETIVDMAHAYYTEIAKKRIIIHLVHSSGKILCIR